MKQEEIKYILEQGGTVEQIMDKASLRTRNWGIWVVLACFVMVALVFMNISLTKTYPLPGEISWDKEVQALALTTDEDIFIDREENTYCLLSGALNNRKSMELVLVPDYSTDSKLMLKIGDENYDPKKLETLENVMLAQESDITLLGYISIAIKGNYQN